MTTILNWLGSIKVTLSQVAVGVMAGLIGVLVILLKVQGSRLHKAQVQLLEQSFHSTMDQQDAKVDAAKAAFHAAKTSYYDNGGE
jgi:hypothetical protein